jgi:hypothetical protein
MSNGEAPLVLRVQHDATRAGDDASAAGRATADQRWSGTAPVLAMPVHAQPVVARETAAAANPVVQSVPLQREPEDGAPPVATPPPVEPGAAALTAAAGAAPSGLPTGDKELDDLAHRLYDRIRSRLRLELLIDRERTGTLSDFG